MCEHTLASDAYAAAAAAAAAAAGCRAPRRVLLIAEGDPFLNGYLCCWRLLMLLCKPAVHLYL
jgi:hypothetical protein